MPRRETTPESHSLVKGEAYGQEMVELRLVLREATQQCSRRGLYFAAKWAAEALAGLNTREKVYVDSQNIMTAETIDEDEQDKVYLGKTYFDTKEFDRTWHLLKECDSMEGRFLALYSKFLAGEKRKEEEPGDLLGISDEASAPTNKELAYLNTELEAGYEQDDLDGFLLYLYAIVLNKRNQKERAIQILIQSVSEYPFNWSAWQELANCITSQETLNRIMPNLPENNVMTRFFLCHMSLELHSSPDLLEELLQPLLPMFPNSTHIKCQRALASYNLREFDEAEHSFDELRENDPYRLDQMDLYSNILYVMEKRPKLSELAHSCVQIDRYRPETAVVIGNYYSLRRENAKAALYFKRALQLNRTYLLAWTLMGHEYVEMKNTNAAIECYRRAVDINQRDYRAWYGLGQTYEFLKLPMYSLYYYQKAASLRPYDARMWCALAACYENLDRDKQAIKCYKRALQGSENETLAIDRLARLYEKIGQNDAAADQSTQVGEAALFLAMYERDHGNAQNAEIYANNALQYPGPIKEDAKALLRELRATARAEQSDDNMDMNNQEGPSDAQPSDDLEGV